VISRASEADSSERPASRPHAGSPTQHEHFGPKVQRADTKPPTLPTHSLLDGAPAVMAVQPSFVTAPAPEPVIRRLPPVPHTEYAAAPPSADVTAQRQQSEPTPPPTDMPLTVVRDEAESPVLRDEAEAPLDATEPTVTNVEPQPRLLSDAPRPQSIRSEQQPDQAARQARPIQRSMATPPIQRVTPPDSSTATPRKLGLGAPIDRSPADATPVETISLQEWVASRDAAKSVQRNVVHAEDPPAVEAAPVVETPLVARADTAPDPDLAAETTGLVGDRSSLIEPTLATPSEPTHLTPSEPTPLEPTLAARLDPSPGVPPSRTEVSLTPLPRGPATTPVQRMDESGREPQRPEPVKRASVPAPFLPIAAAGRSFDAHTPPTSIQRLVTDRAASPMQVVVPPARGVPIAWTPIVPAGSEAHDLPRATPSPATVQRSALGQPVAMTSPAIAQAVEGSSLEPTRATAGTRQTDGDTGAAAVAVGIAHRDADGSVVFAPPASSTIAPNVQRAVQPGETSVAGPPEDAAADQPPPGPASAVAAPATPPAPGGNPSSPHGALDIDDLARRLYDPLAARLKAELRLDRERAGLITDLRRP
jgi:hypothetical protein